MNKLTPTLQGILDWLTINYPDGAGTFSNSGLGRQQIDDLLRESDLNINITEDVYELYQWRNGALWQGFSFIENLIFYSLEKSMSMSPTFHEELTFDDSFRDIGLFPNDIGLIVFSYEHDFFFTVSRQHNPISSELWSYNIKSYGPPFLCYESLISFFLTILECYISQAYYLKSNPYKIWKADRKKSDEIFHKYNSNIWRSRFKLFSI